MKNNKTSSVSQAPSLLQIISSTMLSYLGVSSPSRRARDFQHGDPKVFIGMGFIILVLFIISLAIIVNLVLSNG